MRSPVSMNKLKKEFLIANITCLAYWLKIHLTKRSWSPRKAGNPNK